MKNKQAKRLMLDVCVRVSSNGEVSWMNSISIKGSDLANGATVIHSEYLGILDESCYLIEKKCHEMNFPIREMMMAEAF